MATVPPQSVPIRPAATVILVRDGAGGPEVLMVRRDHKAVFMSGARVFPGGAIDDIDGSDLARGAVAWSGSDEEFPWRAGALRELFEEAGVLIGAIGDIDQTLEGAGFYAAVIASGSQLDADALTFVANWVTPIGPPRRFDARFYLVEASTEVVTDDKEVFDAAWVSCEEALAAADRGEWQLEFPTRATLQMLATYRSAAEMVAGCASTEVIRMAPRLSQASDGSTLILLPGDGGYEEAPA